MTFLPSAPDAPPLKTWQVMHALRKTLGDSFLQKLYKRSLRQIYRWSADPRFCEDTERNPLDRIETMSAGSSRKDAGYAAGV